MNQFTDATQRELRQIDDQGLLAHLMVVTHFVHKHTLEELLASGCYERLSLNFEGYIALLAVQDLSPGELAARLGVSKQVCSKTVRELEALGLIQRRKNPRDSRSSMLSLTETGRQLLRDGIRVTNALDREFAEILGEDRLQQLVRILEKLCVDLGIELPSYDAMAPLARKTGGDRPARLNVLLPKLNNRFRETLLQELTGQGYQGLKSSFGQVLGLVSRQGRKMQYIASVLGISKQAVAASAAELEQLGYIVREPDTEDKRQMILRLSPQGRQLLASSVDGVRRLEATLGEHLTGKEYELLEDTLRALYAQVAEHFDAASVLPAKIQQLSDYLLTELGATGARALAQHLMTITRGDS